MTTIPNDPQDDQPIDPDDPKVLADRMERWNTPADQVRVLGTMEDRERMNRELLERQARERGR